VRLYGCKKALDKKSAQQYEEADGSDGGDGSQINRCMAIEKKIMRKTHLGMLAFSSDEGFVSSDRDTENTGRGGLEGGLTVLTFDLEYDEEGNPIADPAPVNMLSILPLRRSPHSSPQ
jgi:hypothetical protein